MTTVYEAQKALRAEFISNFDDTIPVNFNNRDIFYLCTSPLTIIEKPSDSIWVRFYFNMNNSFQRSFASEGNRDFRRPGMINYQVFVPKGEGTKEGSEVCEEINTIFEGKRFTDIYCYAGTYRGSEVQEDGFYMLVGTIPFDFDVYI